MTVIRLLTAAGLLALPLALPASAQTAPAVEPPAAVPMPPAPPSATMMPMPGLEEVVLPDGRKVLRPAASPSGSSHRCSSQAIS